MIRAATRRLVRSIYVMRCGYCQIAEAEVGAELTYDHFHPRSQGGSDDADNLVYACHACNEFKGEYYGATEETRLLHPLHDDLRDHLRQEADGRLYGITVAGTRYVDVLQLNRLPLLLYRLNTQRSERSDQRYGAIYERFDQISERIRRVEEQLRSRRR